MNLIRKYFPDLSAQMYRQLDDFQDLIREWNEKINLISRKDVQFLTERHILHSLSIAKVFPFPEQSRILDVGTGGGFPGIPLAILYPESRFKLIDSIGKKINVVNSICSELKLDNVNTSNTRIENYFEEYDFVVARAVTNLPRFHSWVRKNYLKGLIYLKGGDLEKETGPLPSARIINISDLFEEEFFETKKIVYIPK
ncbi:MAG: 16S rRNA (guanine(527)-N(7))-methyltransferase RsmG [Bacteroidales bacterium]|nr:16S rRNA (guanine(527)-N(7))-methyltransferase RsmG [Bacteroidales bacterium]